MYFKNIPLEMVIGQQTKKEGYDQNYEWFSYLTFHLFATKVGSVNNVLWASSIKHTTAFKEGTFISDAVSQFCLYYTFFL